MLSVDRGLSWDEAVKKHESHNGQLDGFYCSKREQKGRRLYLLAVEKENAMNLYIIYRYDFQKILCKGTIHIYVG